MLAFSHVNSEMVLNGCTGEPSQKSSRYLMINEEIYTEVVNGTDTRYLIPISSMNCNEKIDAEVKNTESTKHAIQELSGTTRNCDDDVQVETFASRHNTTSDSNSNDVDDDSSDDMIIITDEEESVNQTNNELLSSVNDSYQRVAPLIGLLEDTVSNKCFKPNRNKRLKHYHSTDSKAKDELEVVNAGVDDEIAKRISPKPKYTKTRYERVKMGGTDHFPIKFNKKFASPVVEIGSNERIDSEILNTSSKSKEASECPYCNFKVAKEKLMKHLIKQHIKACFCSICNFTVSCDKLELHSRSHDLRNLRCFMCSFESNNAKRFKIHLFCSHKDPLVRQCSICGDWLSKTHSTSAQIEMLLEHVKTKHLLQPEEII